MARAEAPEACQFVRYASGGQLDGDVIDGAAFKPRGDDQGSLSVNLLGEFAPNLEADLAAMREVLSKWMTIRKTGRFAQIGREALEECAAEAKTAFAFWRDPLTDLDLPDDPSHCLIDGIPDTDDDAAIAVRDMIAIKVSALHLAVVPDPT